MSPLRGVDGQILCHGPGQCAGRWRGCIGWRQQWPVNHLNAGRIPGGATVERAVPTPLGQGDFIHLELIQTDFTTANRMVDAVNRAMGPTPERWMAGWCRCAPRDSNERVQFISKMENLAVMTAENSPRSSSMPVPARW